MATVATTLEAEIDDGVATGSGIELAEYLHRFANLKLSAAAFNPFRYEVQGNAI